MVLTELKPGMREAASIGLKVLTRHVDKNFSCSFACVFNGVFGTLSAQHPESEPLKSLQFSTYLNTGLKSEGSSPLAACSLERKDGRCMWHQGAMRDALRVEFRVGVSCLEVCGSRALLLPVQIRQCCHHTQQ